MSDIKCKLCEIGDEIVFCDGTIAELSSAMLPNLV